MKIFFFMLLSISAYSQVIIEEDFNSFLAPSSKSVALGVLGNKGLTLSGDSVAVWSDIYNSNNLVFAAGQRPTSVGNYVRFSSSNEYCSSSFAINQPNTVFVILKPTNNSVAWWESGTSSNRQLMRTNGGSVELFAGTGIVSHSTISNNNWSSVGAVFNGINSKIYVNGSFSSDLNPGSNNQDNTDFFIQTIGGLQRDFEGDFYSYYVFSEALTESDFNSMLSWFELVGGIDISSKSWISKNGNVLDTSNFVAFYDTIGVPIPSEQTLGSTQEFKLSVNAKSSDSNKTLKIWIGYSDYSKVALKTQTVTGSWATYTFNLGDGVSLSAEDTLWFATNALTDTASIDNIVLKKESHHLIRNVNRWITW